MRWLNRLLNSEKVVLPSTLVTPQWLQEHHAAVNLLDARFALPNSGRAPAAEYAAGHITGARFFDIEHITDKTTLLPHMLPTPADFTAAMVALGFDARKPTVIYDDGSSFGACRCWWMLRVFGYENIALLNGGLTAWRAAGFSVTDTSTPPQQGRFSAHFNPDRVWGLAHVRDNLTNGATLLLDARSAPRFKGEQPEPRAGLPSGHIPGSLNLPSSALLDADTKCFKSTAEIETLLAQTGVLPNEPLAATCGSGMSACVIAFALHLLGRDIPVYDGSWAEWGSTAGCPTMMGKPSRLAPLQ